VRWMTVLVLALAACRPIPSPVDPDAATGDQCDRAGEAMARFCPTTPKPKTMTWAAACRELSVPDETGAVLAPIPVACIAGAGSQADVKACNVRCD
jgi:hypothetical protein